MSFRIMREQRERDHQRMLELEAAKSRCGGSLKPFYRHLVNGERACELCQAVARRASAEDHQGWESFEQLYNLHFGGYDCAYHSLSYTHEEFGLDGGKQLLARWEQASRTWNWDAAKTLNEDTKQFLDSTDAERRSIRRKRQAEERKAAKLYKPVPARSFDAGRLGEMGKPGVYLVSFDDGVVQYGRVADVATRMRQLMKKASGADRVLMQADFVPVAPDRQELIADILSDYCAGQGQRLSTETFLDLDFATTFAYLHRIVVDPKALPEQDQREGAVCGKARGTMIGHARHRRASGIVCTPCRQASYQARDERRSSAAQDLGVPVIGIYALLWSDGCIKVGFSTRMAGRIEEHVIAQAEKEEPRTLQNHFAVAALNRAQAMQMERELLIWCRAQPGMRQEKNEYFYGLDLTVVQEKMRQIGERMNRLAA